jgi:hypothetical protein
VQGQYNHSQWQHGAALGASLRVFPIPGGGSPCRSWHSLSVPFLSLSLCLSLSFGLLSCPSCVGVWFSRFASFLTLLVQAAQKDHRSTAEMLLLQDDTDVDPENSLGHTPLHICACYGSLAVAKVLLRCKVRAR